MSSANTSSEANREDGCEWYFGVPFPSKRKAAAAPATQERTAKIGDKVRVTRLGTLYGGSQHGADVGDVFTVLSADSDSVFTGEWFLWKDEFELLPPSFPPHTRVRVVRNTNRYAVGDTGTVTVSSDESVGVRMDDSRYWSFKPEDLAVAPSPWGAEPAPDCAGRNGEHKFKAGDVVMYKRGLGMGNTRYTIKCVKTHYSDGRTYHGNTAYDFTSKDWWDTEDNLVLVTSATCQQDNTIHIGEFKANLGDVLATACGGTPEPCIVMRLENGQPRPSSWPHVHQSAADATKEAERLASVNPGKQFDVYQRVTGRVGDVQVREVA